MADYLDKAILKLLAEPGTTILTALPPAPEVVPESTAAAIAKCRDAWKRAFDDYVRKNRRKDSWVQEHAAKPAGLAYRAAMPPLVGQEGIRDFIACVAYGILIEAVPSDRANQLLYAAQIAMTSIPRPPKPAKSASSTPSPSPQKQPPVDSKPPVSEANSDN